MHWILVANGEAPRSPHIMNRLATADRVVGVDGGCRVLHSSQQLPHLVIGDMDSIPKPLLDEYRSQGVSIILHPSAKDETDLELALDMALDTGATAITLLGATGGRLDHTLGNLFLLSRCLAHGVAACIMDDLQTIHLVATSLELQGRRGDLFSLIPVSGPVTGVTLRGLRYPLEEATLPFGSPRGLSNVFTEETAAVRIRSGQALVFHIHSS